MKSHPLAFDGAIFDLDGVVTRTARLHFGAWKATFDPLLEESGDPRPFDREDYLAHVDGKPRLDGIRSLLKARGIPVEQALVERLAAGKNERFLALLEEQGPELFDGAVQLLEALRARGVATAMASSSRNARRVVRAAGIEALFDAFVDGNDSAEQGLQGKPAPDIFLAAAQALGVRPERSALFEDATAGVAAGAAGAFCLVVGVDRGGNHLPLRQAGADLVVQHLADLSPERLNAWFVGAAERRPSPLGHQAAFQEALQGRQPAVFLDYDGTLAPIASRPELAAMDEAVLQALRKAAALLPVVVVSGRGRDDVAGRVGLEGLTYAGSHGFEIAGPGGSHEPFPELRGKVRQAAEELQAGLAGRAGVLVEAKPYAAAVHFRLADPALLPSIEAEVDAAAARHHLRKTFGKKIFELRPDVDWDKGRAVRWLVDALQLADRVPIYVGDDRTDEDAFDELAADGIGVVVADRPVASTAHWQLQDPAEVGFFLHWLAQQAR